jgi:co-chaperonin GroES (HSP10)
MSLKPLSNCVLIRQDIEKLSELIVLPQSKLFSGIIVAIGEGKKRGDLGEGENKRYKGRE